jgi:hypothetical protein
LEMRIIPDYNKMGGSGSPWINGPIAPPLNTGLTPSEQRRVQNGPLLCKPWHQIPHNLKGCGGGVKSPMNDYNTDAKKGAAPREQKDVYQNCNDPP